MRCTLHLWGLATALIALPLLGAAKNFTTKIGLGKKAGADVQGAPTLAYRQIWGSEGTPYGNGGGSPSASAMTLDGKILIFGANTWGNVDWTGEGAVYVYLKTKNGWLSQQIIQPPNTPEQRGYPIGPATFPDNVRPNFGNSVGLSHSGKVLAFGAPQFTATPYNVSNQFQNKEGAVYVYVLNTKTKLYEQVAGPIVPSSQRYSLTGSSVAVSGDGKTICAGAPTYGYFDAGAKGAVYCWVYDAKTTTLTPLSDMPILGPVVSTTNEDVGFGGPPGSLALSTTGEWLVVGAHKYESQAGVFAGAVFVYRRSKGAGTYQLVTTFEGTVFNVHFGYALSIGYRDTLLAVGSKGEFVQIYELAKGSLDWNPTIYVNGTTTLKLPDSQNLFGSVLALAYKATTLVVGVPEYDLKNYNITGYPDLINSDNIGAVGVYSLDLKANEANLAYGPYFGTMWTGDSYFGATVSTTADGKLFIASSYYEDNYTGTFAYSLTKSYAAPNVMDQGGFFQN